MRCPGGTKHHKNKLFFLNNFTFATFRISGPTLDPTWAILDPSWAPLTPSWTPLGVSWPPQGVLRAPLGGLWGVQGRLLEPSWPLWEVTWGHLGGAVSRCRSTWCCHGPFRSPMDALRAPIWTIFMRFWAQFVFAVSFWIDFVILSGGGFTAQTFTLPYYTIP